MIDSTSRTPITSTLFEEPYTEPPTVYYSSTAWMKMWHIVHACSKEVGWLGTVEQLDNGDYLIQDIYVPEQTVTSVTADIEPEAVAALAHELESAGIDSSTLRYWGHSHVDMAVSPSDTDEAQIEEYMEHADWFIRGIYNKRGDSKVDIYDAVNNMLYQCVSNEVWVNPLEDAVYKDLDETLKKMVTVRKPVIRAKQAVVSNLRSHNRESFIPYGGYDPYFDRYEV